MELMPPKTDSLIERHQFYASIVGFTQRNTKDNNGLGKKLFEFEEKFEHVRDEVRTSATRSKTIIGVVIFLWSLIGGGVGVYLTRGLQSLDNMVTRLDTAERKISAIDILNEQRRELPDKVDQVRKALVQFQTEADQRLNRLEEKVQQLSVKPDGAKR